MSRPVKHFIAIVILQVMMAAGAWAAVPVITAPTSSAVSPVTAWVDISFSQQITASNSPTRYTASNLPPGLTLNSTTGLITGTPKMPGLYAVAIAAANADGTSFTLPGLDTRTHLYIKVWPASGTGVVPVPDGAGWQPFLTWPLGQVETHTIQAAPLDLTSRFVALDPLPGGLVLNQASLTGAPTVAGLIGARVAVTNQHGHRLLPVTIFTPSPGTDATRPMLAPISDVECNRTDLVEVTPQVASGTAEFFAAGVLPAGMRLDRTTGRIYGEPWIAGDYPVTVAAYGRTGWGTPVSFTLKVAGAPVFHTGAILYPALLEENVAPGAIGISFDSTQPATLTGVENLPAGLSFQAPGSIVGTPTQPGVHDVRMTLSNTQGTRVETQMMVVVRTAWQVLPDTGTSTRLAIAFGAGRFVRVGYSGIIEHSSDNGTTWTAATSGTTVQLSAVAYGGGRFVAVGNGVALTSTDGVTWSALPSLPVFGNPQAVACSDTGTIVQVGTWVVCATPGGSWVVTNSLPGLSVPIGVSFYEGKFVAYGHHAAEVVMSANGSTWESATLPNNVHADLGIGKCGDRYLRSSSSTAKLETSFDGASWVTTPAYKFNYLRAFAHGNGVVVGLGSGSQHVLVRNAGAWESVVSAPTQVKGVRGAPLEVQLGATENPIRFHALNLPDGLTLDEEIGRIHGTVTEAGFIYATVTATNALGPAKPCSITFYISDHTANPPAMAGAPAVGATEGESFAYDPLIQAAVVEPFSVAPQVNYSASGLPPGVVMDPLDGRLSGVPTAAGRYLTEYVVSGVFGSLRQRLTTVTASPRRVSAVISETTSNVRPLWFAGGVFAAEITPGVAAFSADGETWSGSVSIAPGESLSGFAHGADVYVFTTEAAAYVSSDRVNWSRLTLPGAASHFDIMYAGGRFLVPNRASNPPGIATSTDGTTWTEATLPVTNPMSVASIAYGAGVYVCSMGHDEAVYISEDGVTWERVPTPRSMGGKIFYQAGRFVIPSGYPATSADGRTWNYSYEPLGTGHPDGGIVRFGNWLTGHASGFMCFSADGVYWHRISYPGWINTTGIAAGNGRLLVRVNQSGPSGVFISGDQWVFPESGQTTKVVHAGQPLEWRFGTAFATGSLSWRAEDLPQGLTINGEGVVSGTLAVAGRYRSLIWAQTSGGRILEPVAVEFDVRAPTGEAPGLPAAFGLADAVFGKDYEQALPITSEGLGLAVTVTGLPDGLVYDAEERLIKGLPPVPGSRDVTITASDSYGTRTWTRVLRVRNGEFTALSQKPIYSMALAWNGANAHVALGGGRTLDSGAIGFSEDGLRWEDVLVASWDHPLPSLCAVAWGGGQFVAVGRQGTLLTSPDGRTWTRRTAVTSADLFGVGYGGGLWVAVGASGQAVISTDGVAWTAIATGATASLNAVSHDGVAFFAVGDAGTIVRSANGTAWSAVASGTTRNLVSILTKASRYVIGMTGGRVLLSGNGTSWINQHLGFSTHDFSAVYGIAYHPSQGFALTLFNYVGSSSYNTRFFRSTDGITWRRVLGYSDVSRSLVLTDTLVLSGNSSHQLRVLPVNLAPELHPVVTTLAVPNAPFHFDVAPWGISGTVSATGLPPGVTINATTGLISGTPAQPGEYPINIVVQGAPGAKMTLLLKVSAGLPSLLSDEDGRLRVTFVRGQVVDMPLHTLHPATSWRSMSGTANLPAGLRFDTTNGRLVGRPLQTGGFYHQFYTANPWSEVLGSLSIQVLDAEPAFRHQPEPQAGTTGGTLTLTADAVLPGGARYQWFRNGERVTDGGRVSGATTSTLTIQDATVDDAGVYELRVDDGSMAVFSQQATVTVTEAPPLSGYAAWADTHAAVLGDTLPNAKPFGDGISNLLRYALGLPLTQVAPTDYLAHEVREGRLLLRYVRSASVTDVAYVIQVSSDLSGWSETGVTHEKTHDEGEWETWEGGVTLNGARHFLRLRVELAGD